MKLLIENGLGSENPALKRLVVGGLTPSLATKIRCVSDLRLVAHLLHHVKISKIERSPRGRGVYRRRGRAPRR